MKELNFCPDFFDSVRKRLDKKAKVSLRYVQINWLVSIWRQQACNFIKKETLEQVFSCEFCEISKNAFSYRAPLVVASVRKSFLSFI